MERIKKFFNDEFGATLGEYAMLALLIAVAMIGGIKAISIIALK
jgi:Flp pilus assembly pilin Flp